MHATLTLRQKEILTGLSVLLVVALGFGLGEGVIRLTQMQKFGAETTAEESPLFRRDEASGLRVPVPGARRGAISFNSHGFRSPELATPKPETTIRLAFLGSSTTYDQGPTEQTWPHLTVEHLKARLPGCEIDYLNAGVPGFSTASTRKYFEHHVVPHDPDVVVVLPGDLSVDADRLAIEKGISTGEHFRPSWLAERSALWFKIEKNIQVIQLQRSAHRPDGKLQFTRDEFSGEFERRLVALLDSVGEVADLTVVSTISSQLRESQSDAEQLVAANTALFFMPYMSIDGLIAARRYHNDAIRAVGRRHGAIVVDGHDETPGTTEYFLDTAHFSAAGSRLMAQRVANRLLDDPAFRDFLASSPARCTVAGPS